MSMCEMTNSTLLLTTWLNTIAYSILVLPYLFVGTTGNCILLLAFYKQSKVTTPYVYQVILALFKAMEVLSFGLYTLFKQWWVKPGTSSYALAWVTRKLGPPFHMHMIVASALMAVAMSADRVFALTNAVVYSKINHNRHQLLAAFLCFTLPVIGTVTHCFTLKITFNGERYLGGIDVDYINTTISKIFAPVSEAFRAISVVLLISLNTVMVISFQKRSAKAATIRSNNDQSEAARKRKEKTLVLLNLWQSILMCINQIPHAGFHILLFLYPHLSDCATIIQPIADCCIFITDSLDIAAVMAINGRMRKTVMDAFRWGKNKVMTSGVNANLPRGVNSRR